MNDGSYQPKLNQRRMININELNNLAISPEIPFLGEVAKLKVMGDKLFVQLLCYDDELLEHIEALLRSRLPGTQLELFCQTEPKSAQPGVNIKKNINNIIAISSGKGGVGKSSTTVNLALALAASGAKVGILDADIYGPSQPTMLGISERPTLINKTLMTPNVAHGVESNSIGYLVDGDSAMIWRAPMIVNALQQLLNETAWGSSFEHYGDRFRKKNKAYLDYLLIDLPPGTGDISLSLAQKIPVTGAVTVTTPQDIALIDARRSVKMFEKMHIDNIGLIENMSTYICEQCGHESAIFGTEGGKNMAQQLEMTFLGEVPLNKQLRQSLDVGKPLIVAEPNHPISQRYRDIARRIAIILAKKSKSFSQAFGKIVVE